MNEIIVWKKKAGEKDLKIRFFPFCFLSLSHFRSLFVLVVEECPELRTHGFAICIIYRSGLLKHSGCFIYFHTPKKGSRVTLMLGRGLIRVDRLSNSLHQVLLHVLITGERTSDLSCLPEVFHLPCMAFLNRISNGFL